MKGRTAAWALVLVFCCALGGVGRSYDFIQTSRNVALFVNEEEATFVGLRVVFADEVAPLQAIGIGSTFELISNEAGVLTYEGTIIPLGMLEIDWELDGAKVVAAYWIDTDGVEWPIDVASPHARMRFDVPAGSEEEDPGCVPFAPIAIEFHGNWSKDPDGLPLVRHHWSWSDGLHLEGEAVVRTFWAPGSYTVILTVWDVEGLSHSLTEEFYLYPFLCEE